MKYLAMVCLLFLLTTPAFAANRFFDLTGWVTWVDPQSSDTFNSTNPNQPFNISFTGKLGYGIGANVFFGDKISAEFSGSEVRPTAQYGFFQSGAPLSQGDLKMIPLTAVLQYHVAPSSVIDPYIGAGAAYILFDRLQDPHDVGRVGVSRIDFKDDAGLVINGGVAFNFSPRMGITLDGKYVPLKASANAVYVTGPSTQQKIKINPVMASAGLTFHF
jgi:outer membrane protein W